MARSALILILYLLIAFPAIAQGPQLIRKHIFKDSTWVVDNTAAYFIRVELPKLRFADLNKVEDRIKKKQQAYIALQKK